jgi:hypothetical protein
MDTIPPIDPSLTNNTQSTPIPTNQIMTQQSNSSHLGMLIVISLLAGVSLAVAGLFGYQYIQLKKRITEMGTQAVVTTPIPSQLSTSQETSIPSDWKTYANKVFAIKLPAQFDFDSRYSKNPSTMHFTWSEPKNATPIKSIDLNFGYTEGGPKLTSCKTNDECYQEYAKSFSVAGYNKISTTIDGNYVNGFEASSSASNVLIYQNLYPVSHNGKLFTFDIQISAPTIADAKELVPQINQILSTFVFQNPNTSTAPSPIEGYIRNAIYSDGRLELVLDQAEWVNNPNQPNGYEIKNPVKDSVTLAVEPKAIIIMQTYSHTSDGNFNFNQQITQVQFQKYIERLTQHYPFFTLELDPSTQTVIKITEKYQP